MLSKLPVTRSVGARAIFLGTASITAAILWWANGLSSSHIATQLAPIFVYLFSRLDYVGANCSLLILIAAVFVPQRDSFRALLGWIGANPWPIAGVAWVAMCAGTLLVYQNHPLAMDEYAAYFQSQAFAAGELAGKFPPQLIDWLVPRGFQNYFLFVSHSSGRVASAYWPSHALLLAPFTFLGIPWACNPAISALTLPAIHRLALRIFADRETAGLAVLLTVASPVFFANGISYYSMPAHLLANCVFALLLIDPTPRKAAAAGLVGSIALTVHNPVPHMLFAVPWILAISGRRDGVKLLGCLVAGYLPLCLLLGLGWAVFLAGLAQDGAAVTAGAAPPESILERATSVFAFPDSSILFARLIGIAKIWVWTVPGMLVLAPLGAWRWRHNLHCRLLVASAVATLVGFLLVPVDQGHGWGFRYFHSAWMVLPLLAAGALARVQVTTQQSQQGAQTLSDRLDEPGTRTFVVACALLTLFIGIPQRAAQIYGFISQSMAQVPAYPGTERRVEILDPSFTFYGQDLIHNDPWLHGEVIRMITHGRQADAAMMGDHFPDMHLVYTDRYGSVWSSIPMSPLASTPRGE